MVLRYFHPISESYFSPPPATGESFAASSRQPIAEQAASIVNPGSEPVSATQELALEMEQARKKLLDLLLKNPLAHDFLMVQLSNSKGEGVDYTVNIHDKSVDEDIVQDNDLVQPRFDFDSLQQTLNPDFVTNSSEPIRLETIHFFSPLLIRIADQVLQTTSHGMAYKTELIESRQHLRDIRQKIIAANTGLVAFVAYKYKASTLSFDDLMQEGMVGLIRAVDRFDPGRGIRFSTYAVFWIKQAISRLIVKQEKVVRLPVAMAEKASVVFEAMRNCYLENNRWPSLPELQAQCELSMEDIKTISSYYQATHSLDASVSEENDDQTLMSSLKQHQFPLPLDELVDQNLSVYLGIIVASLPEKEATILNMRFGLKNHTEMTLQAIADQLHVTRERVRQIQNEALKKLKQQFGYELLPFLEANDS